MAKRASVSIQSFHCWKLSSIELNRENEGLLPTRTGQGFATEAHCFEEKHMYTCRERKLIRDTFSAFTLE